MKKKYLILLILLQNTSYLATNLATNFALNAKINEVKVKIPSIINLATTAALTGVEHKLTNVSDLVKKN